MALRVGAVLNGLVHLESAVVLRAEVLYVPQDDAGNITDTCNLNAGTFQELYVSIATVFCGGHPADAGVGDAGTDSGTQDAASDAIADAQSDGG